MRKISKVSDLIGMRLENNVISTIEQQINMSFDEFANTLANAANSTSSTSGTVWATVASVVGATALGAASGAAAGPLAPAAAVINGIAGLVTSVLVAKDNIDKKVKNATSLNDSAKKAFDNMLVAIGKYAASEQQKSATSFKASKNSRLY